MTRTSSTRTPLLASALLCVGLALGFLASMGTPASANISGLETKTYQTTINADSMRTLAVACTTGKTALGGGADFGNPSADITMIASEPQGATGDGSDNATGWIAEFYNHEAVSKNVSVTVICGTES